MVKIKYIPLIVSSLLLSACGTEQAVDPVAITKIVTTQQQRELWKQSYQIDLSVPLPKKSNESSVEIAITLFY